MHKETGNSSEQPAGRRMQNGGGGGGGGEVAAEEAANAGPTKRLRRPNVRLDQPYYTGHGVLQRRWNAFKKDLEGARKSRTRKNLNVKNGKRTNNGDGVKELNNLDVVDDDDDDDDDVAIGTWKNSNSGKSGRDFKSKLKRKRVSPSNSKRWLESHENDDQENENNSVSSDGEIEKQIEDEEAEEEDLGDNRINMNRDSDLHCSFGTDKLIDDDNNVVAKQGKMQRGDQDLDDMEVEGGRDNEKNGVRVWLNEMGLGKYATIFEVHEVDDDVLPFLTLEDLKDMGISAVGSRRKMYRSIQKLGRGFS